MALATRSDASRATAMLAPAYLWLTAAIFLPLSAMFFFSLASSAPFVSSEWKLTTANYAAFFSRSLYPYLLGRSLLLSAIVTTFCLIIGYPCAYVLAKQVRGRAREALFLLVILPFWSNSLVRIFSWAIVLRGNGVLDLALNAVSPLPIQVDLMFSTTAIVIGLVHSYVPYVVLTSYLALQAIDDSLIDAARSLGAPFRTILLRLLLPLSLPGIVAGATLIFVPVAGSFMEARILGGRAGTLYGTVIEDQFVAVFNWPLGAALSFILLAVIIVIFACSAPMLRRAQS
jgi:spermidine/putrescine transport system permease protein